MRCLEGTHAVVIQAKERRFGAGVFGQAVCSAALVSIWKPRGVETVALVTGTDDDLLAATRSLPDVFDANCVRSDWWGAEEIAERHRTMITALLRALQSTTIKPLVDPDHPYKRSKESLPTDADLENWFIERLGPVAEQHPSLGTVKTRIVRDEDMHVWAIHSHGRGERKGKRPTAKATLPLIGHALASYALLRRAGEKDVTTVVISETVNGSLVPLLVPFPWLRVAARSPTPRAGAAADFISRGP